MSKVVLDITVSLDGFIAPPNNDVTRLHEWLFNGDTPSKYNDFFKLSEESAKVFDELVRTTGSEGKVPPRPPSAHLAHHTSAPGCWGS